MFFKILISMALASDWLVKAPEALPQEFAVYAQNSTAEKISSYFLKCELKQALQEDLKKAQILFLDGDLQKAKKQFLQVVEKKWSCDWADEERQIISFSFFRLAQLEQEGPHPLRWIEEAVQFDDAYIPDATIFPPPLIEAYKQALQKDSLQKVTLPLFAKKFSALLRNGRFISLSQLSVQARDGKARYTFVSDAYQIEKLFVRLQELETLSLQPQALVSGSCENFQLHESLHWLSQVLVFHGLDCIKSSTQNAQGSTSSPVSQKLSDYKNVPEAPQEIKTGTWLQRNGLWLGTAIVGSVLLTMHLNNQDREQRVMVPTTTLNQ
jgi:hypothetical protein